MAEITITITRQNVYAIAEGISATISMHNGGTPTYEQLWASPDEAPKLDIHYREAVSDLERKLMLWVASTSSQFDLTQDGTDYTLHLSLSALWPTHLQGLLANKVQDYMVHAVTAGWLNDFSGLDVKMDYAEMAANDLDDIREILHQRSFNWHESARNTDTETKDDGISPSAGARSTDTETKDDGISPTAGERSTDTETKDDGISPTAGERSTDTETKDDGISPSAGERAADTETKDDGIAPTAGERSTDTETKDDGISPSAGERSTDTETKDDGISPSAGERAADTETKDDGIAPTATNRKGDQQKNYDSLPADPVSRKKDDVRKPDANSVPPLCRPPMLRHKDNAIVTHHQDYTDWSGTDYGRVGCRPPRDIRHSERCMPHGHHGGPRPCPPPPPVPPCQPQPHDCRTDCPQEHPHNPYEHINTCQPHPHDEKAEEQFISSHVCGHHDCGHHGVNPLDWDFSEAGTEEELDDATDATFT